ncbi:hypothetical protein [Crenobacter caeni]|uniref:Flagellar protein FliT n=1 Tax=Crenobacter caeni TaxID=2705474 RepID=A0A6B2KRN1_9NEIS|nr:hypothetical protein [Crenobacter caeni]NDV12794.1 hypothetical protein [Crenobacter caeni]
MQAPLDLKRVAQNVREAVHRCDWDALGRLDVELARRLSAGPGISDKVALEQACEAYRDAIVACRERASVLRAQMDGMAQAQTVQRAYAAFQEEEQ